MFAQIAAWASIIALIVTLLKIAISQTVRLGQIQKRQRLRAATVLSSIRDAHQTPELPDSARTALRTIYKVIVADYVETESNGHISNLRRAVVRHDWDEELWELLLVSVYKRQRQPRSR